MSKVYINKGKGLGFKKTSADMPEGLDYENLMNKLKKQEQPEMEDLRQAKHYPLELIDDSNTTDKLIKDTVIPIPGLLVNYENDQHGTPPRPTDGPVVPGGGLNWGGEF